MQNVCSPPRSPLYEFPITFSCELIDSSISFDFQRDFTEDPFRETLTWLKNLLDANIAHFLKGFFGQGPIRFSFFFFFFTNYILIFYNIPVYNTVNF